MGQRTPKPLPRSSGRTPLFPGRARGSGGTEPPLEEPLAAEALCARPELGSWPRAAHSGPRPGAPWCLARASPPGHPAPEEPARTTELRRTPPCGPGHWLPVFALVFLLLPHRVSAALVAPAPLFGLSQTHCPPADFGLFSAWFPSHCRLSHPALHRRAHWDRAHMV